MAENPATEIIELMLEHKVGALPVLDADGRSSGSSATSTCCALYELEAEAAAS